MPSANLPFDKSVLPNDPSVWQCEVLALESDERLIGRYASLARLSTSVRFNKPQMEIIESDAAEIREVLEARGLTFGEPS
jgi:hypothetical protein